MYDNKEKTNMFNNFFLYHSPIDLSNARLPNDEIVETAEFINHVEVTEVEVLDLIHNIDPNIATGPDGISPKLLREAGSAIAPSLTRLVKLSLQKSQIPKSEIFVYKALR